jgi:hypothetical protein
MKCFCFSICLSLSVLVAQGVGAQEFINLDFESANVPHLSPEQWGGGYVPISDAVPGWTCAIDGVQITEVLNNNGTAGGPSLSIWGQRATFVGGVLQGSQTVILSAGFGDASGHTTSLSQTGLIPLSARSLLFKAAPYDQTTPGPADGLFSVFMGGSSLDYYPLSIGVNYTLYGASIPSEFAGTVQSLMFTDASFPGTWHYEKLDDIQFTAEPIPEPSMISLVALSVALTVLRSRGPNRGCCESSCNAHWGSRMRPKLRELPLMLTS